MKIASVVFAAAVLLAVCAPSNGAEARPRGGFSFGYYGPGVSVHIGRYPYYYHGPYYYQPYYYQPYYYRPYSYRRAPAYRHRRSSSRCGYWSRRCARRWGYRNSNYYGCMRYEGCR